VTRKISVGLVVDVPDDIVAEGHEALYCHLEAGLLNDLSGNICSIQDITDEIAAAVARAKAGRSS